jgi:excisionase family DNA binding protein
VGEDRTRGPSRTDGADLAGESGWVTTEVAARALRVSPRTIRRLIKRGELEAKSEGEGVKRTWSVSVASLHKLRASRTARGALPEPGREATGEEAADTSVVSWLVEMSARLEERAAEAAELRTRLELTERAHSTLEEEAQALREERDRLRAELEAERSKGFWARLFGG